MADLSCVKMILLTDPIASSSECQANVNSFLKTFRTFAHIRPNCLWSCSYSSESMTFAIGPIGNESTTLSMYSMCHLVVRPEHVASGAAVNLGTAGQVLPNCVVAVIKIEGPPILCQSDEIGEFVVSSPSISPSGHTVCPMYPDGQSISCEDHYPQFIKTGFYGYFNVVDRERLVIVAELNKELGCCQSDQCSFAWMNYALRTLESSHYVCAYCIVLVAPNRIPLDQSGTVDRFMTQNLFLSGRLNPLNVLVCPHLCLADLPCHDKSPSSLTSTLSISNHLSGSEESKPAVSNTFLIDTLINRCQSAPDNVLFTMLNAKCQYNELTCESLYKKLDKVLCVLLDKLGHLRIQPGDRVILLFTPSVTVDIVPIYLACTKLNMIAIPIRSSVNPKHNKINVNVQMSILRPCINMLNPKLIITNIPQLQPSRQSPHHMSGHLPHIVVLDTLSRHRTSVQSAICSPMWRRQSTGSVGALMSYEQLEDGSFSAAELSYSTLSEICRILTETIELYPSREILLCIDPFGRLGFILWNIMSVYAGHESILLPLSELQTNPLALFTIISQKQVRDVFLSLSAIEYVLAYYAMFEKGDQKIISNSRSLESIRSCVILCDGRVPCQKVQYFIEMLRPFGLDPSSVSTCLGCPANFLICLQKPNEPDTSVICVRRSELAFDRVAISDSSEASVSLMESGRLLPNVHLVVVDRYTRVQCHDMGMGEIYVQSAHNTDRIFISCDTNGQNCPKVSAVRHVPTSSLNVAHCTSLGMYDCKSLTLGILAELLGLSYYPTDIEETVMDLSVGQNGSISRCACFAWAKLVVVAAEWTGNESDALDIVPVATTAIANQHKIIVGVVVIVDPGTIPVSNSDGKIRRSDLKNAFLSDNLNPMYVVYNM
ncbi:hypothetical protein ACOME3_007813 [Neoechinorhynchus agilis]